MEFKRSALFVAACVPMLLAALWPSPVASKPRNTLGAKARVSVGATDNAFSQPTGKRSDIFLLYSAGITVGRRLATGTVDLDLGLTGYVSSEFGSLTQFFGDSGLSLAFPITNRIELQLSDRFVPSPLQFSDIDESRVNQTQANNARGVILYDIPLSGPWSSELSTSIYMTDFIDVDNQFSSGSKPDRLIVSVDSSLTRQLGRRSSVSLSGGFRRTRFDDAGPPGSPLENFSQASGTLNWTYQPRRQFQLSLDGGVGVFFTDAESQATGIGAATLTWTPTPRSKVVLEGRRIQGTQLDGKSFETSSAAIEASHLLTRRLTLEAGLLYVLLSGTGVGAATIPGGANSQLVSARAALSLSLGRNFETSASFRHTRNFGDFTGDDFARSTGLVSLGVNY